MHDKSEVVASELPVLRSKGAYKYLDEIATDGSYQQVGWERTRRGWTALYGQQPIQVPIMPDPIMVFPLAEEGGQYAD